MCCIEPSINQPIPGMPNGKKAGERCVNLNPETFVCSIWGQANYPNFCKGYQPDVAFCGDSRNEAEHILRGLEISTAP